MLNNIPNPLRAAYPELGNRTAMEALQNPAIPDAAAGLPVFTGPGGVAEAKTAEAARAALGLAPALQADVTIYVSPTGSDAEGDGSQAAPYFSINKAVAGLPKNLNGYTAIIDMAAGTYNYTSRQTVSYFLGGTVSIRGKYTGSGASATPTTIIDFGEGNNGLYIIHSYKCGIDSLKIFCVDRVLNVSGGICSIRLLQADGRGSASSTGICVDFGASAIFCGMVKAGRAARYQIAILACRLTKAAYLPATTPLGAMETNMGAPQ